VKIGEKLRKLRMSNSLTQEELASRADLTKGYISQLENDATSPSISTLKDLLDVLGVSMSEFFAEKLPLSCLRRRLPWSPATSMDCVSNCSSPGRRTTMDRPGHPAAGRSDGRAALPRGGVRLRSGRSGGAVARQRVYTVRRTNVYFLGPPTPGEQSGKSVAKILGRLAATFFGRQLKSEYK
jgi:DNA-binding XRE family transcriptional regulator